MTPVSRRKLLLDGTVAAAGLAGLATADRIARRYGLIPPDAKGKWGPGKTLTYACQRVLTRHADAREFSRSQISQNPFANIVDPLGAEFARLHAGGFKDWRITIDGTVAHPLTLSLADLKALPMQNQITEVACEEGWSYIAEWIGTPLSAVLREAGALPQTKFVVLHSIQSPQWWDSLDMAGAMHPQTLITFGMNDSDLTVPFGGPVRMRVPRQLGYKSLKYVTRITATDDIRKFGLGLGSFEPENDYSWYAGI